MDIIAHRRNTIEELTATDTRYGIEVDIRGNNNKLIIHHDPFTEGEDLSRWIEYFQHGILILNVKEEGLETRLIDLMALHKIENYFFLDQSFPFLIKTARQNESRCAVRVSEYESVETVLSLSGMVDWVWIDYFTKFPLSKTDIDTLQEQGFKLCLVSPELQGYDPQRYIPELRTFLDDNKITLDAVCTKQMKQWEG